MRSPLRICSRTLQILMILTMLSTGVLFSYLAWNPGFTETLVAKGEQWRSEPPAQSPSRLPVNELALPLPTQQVAPVPMHKNISIHFLRHSWYGMRLPHEQQRAAMDGYQQWCRQECRFSFGSEFEQQTEFGSNSITAETITDPRARTADALIFVGDESWLAETARVRPTQKLVYMGMEAYMERNRIFNLRSLWDSAWTFRTAADNTRNYRLSYNVDPPERYYDIPYIESALAFGDRYEIFWASSHCVYPARERYVRQLMRLGLDIYAFGKCLHQERTEKMITECEHRRRKSKRCLLPHFKFTLAVENTFADGYITEKFYEALQSPAVLIYKGAPDIYKYFPKEYNAFINVDDFPSSEALAEHVQRVSSDETLYRRYFEWRYRGQMKEELQREYQRSMLNFHCLLCEQLVQEEQSALDGKGISSAPE